MAKEFKAGHSSECIVCLCALFPAELMLSFASEQGKGHPGLFSNPIYTTALTTSFSSEFLAYDLSGGGEQRVGTNFSFCNHQCAAGSQSVSL